MSSAVPKMQSVNLSGGALGLLCLTWEGLVDRYARSIKGADVTVETVMSLFDELGDVDEEHSSISVIDSDEWNLEIYPDFMTFENVEELGSPRQINDPTRDEIAEIVREFTAGDFEAVRSHGWQR